MPKTNCNIIKDLLPSYLDEICSKESEQMIQEHFNECENCKKLYEQNKAVTFHSKTDTSANHTREIDYFKIIKRNVNKKNTFLLILTAILLFIQLYFNFQTYRFSGAFADMLPFVNYIFPVLIAGTLFAILPDYTEEKIPNKIKLPILGIEFTTMTYMLVLLIFIRNFLLNETIPFGMEAWEIGPFFVIQLLAFAIGFLITFILSLIISLCKKAVCPAICFVPLGGLSLMLEYINTLHRLDTTFELASFIQPYVILTCEIAALVGIYMFVNRRK